MSGEGVASIFWSSADRAPRRIVVTEVGPGGPPTEVSYAELAGRVAQLAGGLEAAGFEAGDRIALLMNNRVEYVETFLAAISRGMIAVPLNVRLVGADYAHMLSDSGSRLLVTEPEFLERWPEISEVPDLEFAMVGEGDRPCTSLEDLAGRGPAIAGAIPRESGEVVTLMYTSGTTGAPKAVMLTDESWRVVSERCSSLLEFGTEEAALHAAPLTHGAGFLLFPTIAAAGNNVLCRSFLPHDVPSILEEQRITVVFLVPSMIRMLLDALPAGWKVPPTFRCLYYAGSPIDPETMRDATRAFEGRLQQSFGQMESPMFLSLLDSADHARILAAGESPIVRSAGRVLPGVELKIVDDDGRELGPDAPGAILARAPQTMSGYWGRPTDSTETLRGGWLHTGDIGCLDREGYLYIVDRQKDMIISGGSNVYAREVEEVLGSLSYLADSAVIGTPDRVWGEAVTAVVVSGDGSRDDQRVIDDCKRQLAGYRCPKRVIWVDELPRNAYGKVLKRRLRDRYGHDRAAAPGA